MSDIYKGELQDNQGNTIYPHTEADITFCADGETVQKKLTDYENALGNVTGVTDSLEVNDSRILATSKALKKVNDSLGGVSQFIVDETTGKITGYKTEIGGADTVFPFKSAGDYEMINNTTFSNTSGTVTATSDYKGIFVSMPLNTYMDTNKYSSIKINGEEKVNEALCSTDGTVMFLPIIGYNGDSIAITRTVNYATVNVAFVN